MINNIIKLVQYDSILKEINGIFIYNYYLREIIVVASLKVMIAMKIYVTKLYLLDFSSIVFVKWEEIRWYLEVDKFHL